jgi:hypothetical protein
VAGSLGFFILFDVTSDLERWQGRSLVAALAIAGLWLLRGQVRRRAWP